MPLCNIWVRSPSHLLLLPSLSWFLYFFLHFCWFSTPAKHLTDVWTAVTRDGGTHYTHLLKHFMDAIKMELLEDGISDRFLESTCSFALYYPWPITICDPSNSCRLMLIIQPYKKSYMNVLDGLLLAVTGFLILLIVTFLYMLPSSRSETLPLIIMITSSVPMLVLLFPVFYRQLKGKHIMRFIAGKVNILLMKICTQEWAEEEISVADSLPHRLICPDQYDRSLLSESEQTHVNTEAPTVRQVSPVYTYGSIS